MADGNLPTYVTESTTLIWAAGVGFGIRPAGSFVNFAGTNAVLGAGFAGVSNQDLDLALTNVPIGVDMEGIVQAIAGGPITIGSPMTCGFSNGQFTVASAGADVYGRALSAATVPGQRFLMKITREGKA